MPGRHRRTAALCYGAVPAALPPTRMSTPATEKATTQHSQPVSAGAVLQCNEGELPHGGQLPGEYPGAHYPEPVQLLHQLPGEGGYFDLSEGAQSIVHMPDGPAQPATQMWIRNNGTGTLYGYPMQ